MTVKLPNDLSSEQQAAIVACLRIFAARGRSLRLERQQKTKTAETVGTGTAGLADATGTSPEVCPDATP
jgi:hypothetical protein